MKINAIQNISFNKIDPELKKEIMAEHKRLVSNSYADSYFEYGLNYIENNDTFELKGRPKANFFTLETIPKEEEAPIVVHSGQIEDFLRLEPEDEQMLMMTEPDQYRAYKNMYRDNFAHTKFDSVERELA